MNAENNWITRSGYAQLQSDLAVGWPDQGQPRVGLALLAVIVIPSVAKRTFYPIPSEEPQNPRNILEPFLKKFSEKSTSFRARSNDELRTSFLQISFPNHLKIFFSSNE